MAPVSGNVIFMAVTNLEGRTMIDISALLFALGRFVQYRQELDHMEPLFWGREANRNT
jgi:hypothetical protein